MKILSIIGTRPQYIKIKPIFDFCKKNNINHEIVDTRQHYSHNVSDALIENLDLNIDYSLNLSWTNELSFISECIKTLGSLYEARRPDLIIVYGDTNSTLCAALAAYKLKIPLAHVEAGERCFDLSVPEELTRRLVDDASEYNFCSSVGAMQNLSNGIYCGDLEYELLNQINPNITFQNFGVMTIHRQANSNTKSLIRILSLCDRIPFDINFYIHHRIRPLLPGDIPPNVNILDPCTYTDMVDRLSSCSFIITDSGSIQKTSPFFGKRTLVMREKSEWKKTETENFAKLVEFSEKDIPWLLEGRTNRNKIFYLNEMSVCLPSSIIIAGIGGV
jgi:UDP-GlcNAc3NAcA epimerase